MRFVVIYNRIPALIAFVESESRVAVKKRADRVASRARELAPVATGYLRSSIHSEVVSAGKEALVAVDAPYAIYQEYGTYKMPAHPFLQPAVSENADDFFEDVGRGLFARF